jgi:TIR domain
MPVPIFVSYSHQDAGLVKPVVGLLRATKDLIFQDVDAIMPGSRWRPQIEEALDVAHLIVLFWCCHSSRSAEVRKEYESALSTGKDVLPVLLDATPLPKELSEFQWVDFRQFVGLGHRFVKRWIAIATTVSVLMMGFLAAWFMTSGVEHKIEAPVEKKIEAPEPAPKVEVPPLSESAGSAEREEERAKAAERPLPTEAAPSTRPPLPTEKQVKKPAPLPPSPPGEPAPLRMVFSSWLLWIVAATVLALVVWLVRKVRRTEIRKKMAATLQEELFRRGV